MCSYSGVCTRRTDETHAHVHTCIPQGVGVAQTCMFTLGFTKATCSLKGGMGSWHCNMSRVVQELAPSVPVSLPGGALCSSCDSGLGLRSPPAVSRSGGCAKGVVERGPAIFKPLELWAKNQNEWTLVLVLLSTCPGISDNSFIAFGLLSSPVQRLFLMSAVALKCRNDCECSLLLRASVLRTSLCCCLLLYLLCN